VVVATTLVFVFRRPSGRSSSPAPALK